MKRITLEQKEYKKIGTIIDKYREIETSLTSVQEQLEKLDKEKDDLLSRLDKIREEETAFFSGISEKHGTGKLDLLTMEYVTDVTD
mgnify:CR=1 FL=1